MGDHFDLATDIPPDFTTAMGLVHVLLVDPPPDHIEMSFPSKLALSCRSAR
jgi:hypothetical protein